MKKLDTKTLKTVSGGTFGCGISFGGCNPCGGSSKKSGKC